MSAKKSNPADAGTASSNGGQSSRQEKPECFVIMPISDPEGYEPGHFRRVYEDLFIPACEAAGYQAVRADQVQQTNLIHLDVLQKIVESPMALCDLSSRNPNVLFELGLRQAFDKPVVLVREVGTPDIFDINPLRYASYRKEMLYRQVIEDQKKIEAAIKETKEAIGDNRNINSIVKLLSLTHAASLTNVSEGDKEPALLQVIMREIGNLRSEFRSLLTAKGREESQAYAVPRSGEEPINKFVDTAYAVNYIERAGLEDYLLEAEIPLKLIRQSLQNSVNAEQFVQWLAARSVILSAKAGVGIKTLSLIKLSFLENAFAAAKARLPVSAE